MAACCEAVRYLWPGHSSAIAAERSVSSASAATHQQPSSGGSGGGFAPSFTSMSREQPFAGLPSPGDLVGGLPSVGGLQAKAFSASRALEHAEQKRRHEELCEEVEDVSEAPLSEEGGAAPVVSHAGYAKLEEAPTIACVD